jgi:hypothetical protein
MYNKKTAVTLSEEAVNRDFETEAPQIKPNLNIQVKALKQRAPRRKFSPSDKLKILEAFDTIDNPQARGEFLRKEGLYYASIVKWRKQISEKKSNPSNSKAHQLKLVHNQVLRENVALKKKLAQAEAIIELQKKVSELLSQHILEPEMSGEK